MTTFLRITLTAIVRVDLMWRQLPNHSPSQMKATLFAVGRMPQRGTLVLHIDVGYEGVRGPDHLCAQISAVMNELC